MHGDHTTQISYFMSSECKLLNIMLCCGLPVFFAVFSSVANSGQKPEMVICLEERGWNGLRVMSVTTVLESWRQPWSHRFVTKISPTGREPVCSCCCCCTIQCDHAQSFLGFVDFSKLSWICWSCKELSWGWLIIPKSSLGLVNHAKLSWVCWSCKELSWVCWSCQELSWVGDVQEITWTMDISWCLATVVSIKCALGYGKIYIFNLQLLPVLLFLL